MNACIRAMAINQRRRRQSLISSPLAPAHKSSKAPQCYVPRPPRTPSPVESYRSWDPRIVGHA